MAAARTFIDFAEFMDRFRQQENNEDATLGDQIDSVLSSTGESLKKYLVMGRSPPSDETEFLVFDALIARKETTSLGFRSAFDASCMPPLISRIEKGTLKSIALAGMPLSGSQATDTLEKIANLGLKRFTLYLREDYGSDVIHAFRHFLQESSIHFLALGCLPGDWISAEALHSICEGILNLSVNRLRLRGLKVQGDNVERAHETLVETILDSSSVIKWIQVDHYPDEEQDVSLELLSRSLCQHAVIQNLDVCFRVRNRYDNRLVFDRKPWWKRLLAMDDLPLILWPILLEKADTWNRDASHSHLDVLYFLLKEKNTELLQNVRRRRIRKRKRYGF